MNKYFEKIERLKAVRREKDRLIKEEKELLSPTLIDYDKLPEIYGWFKDILNDRPCPPHINTVLQRKKFLFIVLYLYCPGALCGDKLPYRIRTKIADLFSPVSPNVISQNISDIVFIYQNYKDFKNEVDDIFYQIVDKIRQG